MGRGVYTIRFKGVAVFLPPGVEVLKVHIFLREGGGPVLLEKPCHFLAIICRFLAHPSSEQVKGTHVARAKPFNP
eukprot:9109447-Heterocapsa_arctica.AAC.1